MIGTVTTAISIAALLLSAIAIGASIWAHSRTHMLQKRILRLEEEREEDRLIEKGKAHLTARIEKEEILRSGSSRIYRKDYLVVDNKGMSEASNIEVLLKDQALSGNPLLHAVEQEVSHIGPQSSFRYEFAKGFRRELPLRVQINWQDDSGELGKYQTTLTE